MANTPYTAQQNSWVHGVVLAGTTCLVFVVDCLTPLGWAPWVLYFAPLAISVFSTRPGAPLWVAAFASVFVVVGYWLSPRVGDASELALINRVFGFASLWGVAFLIAQVVRARQLMRKHAWLSSCQSRIANEMAGTPPLDRLGPRVLTTLAELVGAPVGALYVRDLESLRRLGSLGLDLKQDLAFRIGEGLPGKAALGTEPVLVTGLSAEHLTMPSSLGQLQPQAIVAMPMRVDDEVQNVVELGFLNEVPAEALELLRLVAPNVALVTRSSKYRAQLEILLQETQRQAEALQMQQEELRVTNEELEEHGKALREQQQHLEKQQAELEQSNVQLEEYTQQLLQQRGELTRAREELARKAQELENASRYKSEFLANMSHELRTPLNSSLILAKLLADNREATLTPKQVEYARSITSAGNDLLGLINDILDFSKIEAGKMEVRLAEVRLPRALEQLTQTFRPVAEQKKLTFRVTRDESAPNELRTDPQRLQQILKNLLSNAFKFTEHGEVELRVRREGTDQVAFEVRDTGVGIAPEQQECIFEAFRQADGGATRKFAGTGLGLSISRSFARLLGGTLTVASESGKGSTFTLTLPMSVPSVVEDTHTPAVLAAPNVVPLEPVRARHKLPAKGSTYDDRDQLTSDERSLLIVEDDPAFAKILYDLAHELGFKALIAHGADEGYELAREYRPAAIVLDINLPDHSGLTVLDRLKRNPTTRHIPVQVVSVVDYTQSALEMGAAGYLLKPVDREKLVSSLSKLEERFQQRIRSVLVVEDDARQRESICQLLNAEEVQTVPVANAAQALEQLRTTTYDCVVLDISLPDATGYELLEKMAGDDAYSFPPVIVYTGRSLSAEEEHRLRKYSSSIIIKGARSPERLLDEVTLFLHQVETRLPAERQRMLAAARARESAFEGRQILIVEDDVRNIFALTSVLEPRGGTLRIARNGREALDSLATDPFVDLILMDIMMPEMDGYTAMQEIRKRPELRKVPIIAITAKAMRDDQEKCLAAGANDYVAKPIDVEKLLSLMRVWMPRREASA